MSQLQTQSTEVSVNDQFIAKQVNDQAEHKLGVTPENLKHFTINGVMGIAINPSASDDLFFKCRKAIEIAAYCLLYVSNILEHTSNVQPKKVSLLTVILHASEHHILSLIGYIEDAMINDSRNPYYQVVLTIIAMLNDIDQLEQPLLIDVKKNLLSFQEIVTDNLSLKDLKKKQLTLLERLTSSTLDEYKQLLEIPWYLNNITDKEVMDILSYEDNIPDDPNNEERTSSTHYDIDCVDQQHNQISQMLLSQQTKSNNKLLELEQQKANSENNISLNNQGLQNSSGYLVPKTDSTQQRDQSVIDYKPTDVQNNEPNLQGQSKQTLEEEDFKVDAENIENLLEEEQSENIYTSNLRSNEFLQYKLYSQDNQNIKSNNPQYNEQLTTEQSYKYHQNPHQMQQYDQKYTQSQYQSNYPYSINQFQQQYQSQNKFDQYPFLPKNHIISVQQQDNFRLELINPNERDHAINKSQQQIQVVLIECNQNNKEIPLTQYDKDPCLDRDQKSKYSFLDAMQDIEKIRNDIFEDFILKNQHLDLEIATFINQLRLNNWKVKEGVNLKIDYHKPVDVNHRQWEMHHKHIQNSLKAKSYNKTGNTKKLKTQEEVNQEKGKVGNDQPKQVQDLEDIWPMPKEFQNLQSTKFINNRRVFFNELDSPIRNYVYVKNSKILLNYHTDLHYLKYNFVATRISTLSSVEMAILQEMCQHCESIFKHTVYTSNISHSGSPYFLQGNYRLMYFPHKFSGNLGTDPSIHCEAVPFHNYQKKNINNVFNYQCVFKKEKRANYQTYYSYLDELMNVANIIMDAVIYNDRRAFAVFLACLNPMLKLILMKEPYITPDFFPFEDVMNTILFNRHMQNYHVECFYSTEDVHKKELIGELVEDISTIIMNNYEVFKPILAKGSVIVEFSYFYRKVKYPQVHFAVVRQDNQDKSLYMQSSKVICERLPVFKSNSIGGSNQTKFIKDELFFDNIQSNKYRIDIYRVKFYSCVRQMKPPVSSFSNEHITYHFNIRNRLVLFFSMYSLLDLKQMHEDFTAGAKRIMSITNLLQKKLKREYDSEGSESDDHENNSVSYRRVRQGHTLLYNDKQLEEGLEAFKNQKDKDWLSKLHFNNHSIEEQQEKVQTLTALDYIGYLDFVFSYSLLEQQIFFLESKREMQTQYELLKKVRGYFEEKLKGHSYIEKQTKQRMGVIKPYLRSDMLQFDQCDYSVSLDICYWIYEDIYSNFNMIYDPMLIEKLDKQHDIIMNDRITKICTLPLDTLRVLLKFNATNANTAKNHISLYGAPRLYMDVEYVTRNWWHGYGYGKLSKDQHGDDYERHTVVSSLKSRASSRASNKSNKNCDDDSQHLQKLILPGNGKKGAQLVENINVIDANFYRSIYIHFEQQNQGKSLIQNQLMQDQQDPQIQKKGMKQLARIQQKHKNQQQVSLLLDDRVSQGIVNYFSAGSQQNTTKQVGFIDDLFHTTGQSQTRGGSLGRGQTNVSTRKRTFFQSNQQTTSQDKNYNPSSSGPKKITNYPQSQEYNHDQDYSLLNQSSQGSHQEFLSTMNMLSQNNYFQTQEYPRHQQKQQQIQRSRQERNYYNNQQQQQVASNFHQAVPQQYMNQYRPYHQTIQQAPYHNPYQQPYNNQYYQEPNQIGTPVMQINQMPHQFQSQMLSSYLQQQQQNLIGQNYFNTGNNDPPSFSQRNDQTTYNPTTSTTPYQHSMQTSDAPLGQQFNAKAQANIAHNEGSHLLSNQQTNMIDDLTYEGSIQSSRQLNNQTEPVELQSTWLSNADNQNQQVLSQTYGGKQPKSLEQSIKKTGQQLSQGKKQTRVGVGQRQPGIIDAIEIKRQQRQQQIKDATQANKDQGK